MSDPTACELFKATAAINGEVNAAVDVFMREATVSLFRFTNGYVLEPAAAVKAHEPATRAVLIQTGPKGSVALWCGPRSCWRGRWRQ